MRHSVLASIAAASALTLAGVAGLALSQSRMTAAAPEADTPTDLLTRPVSASLPNADQVRRGQYLVVVGDCVSCHTRDGGTPMAGGLGMNTPFGTIYSPNLTSDAETGIGNWTPDQLYRAMRTGVDAHGDNLYPAFPYPNFTRVSRADSDALLAYLKTIPAVNYTPPANKLPFPLNIRFAIKGWNLLFFRTVAFTPDASKSAEWNRGAYIVNGLGHCGACHTPKNMLGADKKGVFLQGGELDNWLAPNLTGNDRVGLGQWSEADIVQYLKAGRNRRAAAAGSMAEVVSYSTSLMTDADRHAIAVYLKDQAASPTPDAGQPDDAAMKRGAEVYSDACASCHLEQGKGQPGYFPPLAGDTMAQQGNPDGLIHLILAGGRTAPAPTAVTPLSMPSFAWKLDDQQIADVSTYIRNSWGSKAKPVGAGEVAAMRRHLNLKTSYLTVNSGDHFGP
jgi:mono/diheme cytochrome c family protein